MLDNKGNMYVEDDDIVELMLRNRQVKILPRDLTSFNKFKTACKTYGLNESFELAAEMSDKINWNMPVNYQNLNVREFIRERHPNLTSSQWQRIELELEDFESRNLTDLLRFLVYFVDVLRANNIVYGVGRGSSIASYVLYLIGVHRIDSYKFNLDIKEFLK